MSDNEVLLDGDLFFQCLRTNSHFYRGFMGKTPFLFDDPSPEEMFQSRP